MRAENSFAPDRLARLGLVVQAGLIALAIALGYGHTLEVPFYFDDYLTIQTNPAVKRFDLASLWRTEPLRFLGYLSLALDYRLHGLKVAGYHLTNLFLHYLTALAVWQWVRELLKTPGRWEAQGKGLPLVAALLFAVHPLQTQAVTYISQRFAVLAALFYVTALICYLRLRLADTLKARWMWGGGLVFAAGAALFSKQNAATLPLAILLVEIVFFPNSRFAPWLRRGALLGLGVGVGLLASASYWPWAPLKALDLATRETDWFGRLDYLAAQVKILWWYLRLFFWPVGLRLDYAAHQVPAWTEPWVILAAAGHLALLSLALWGLRRVPLLAFGLWFYYTAHLVESSLIPIRDLIFEHRTYLPNAGLTIACAFALLVVLPNLVPRAAWLGPGVVALGLVGLGWQTWQRNQLWRDPIRFWEDNVRLEPQALRPKLELAREYFDRGKVQEALALGRQIAATTPWPPKSPLPQSVAVNLAAAYLVAGNYDLALQVVEEMLTRPLLPQIKKRLFWVQGQAYLAQQRLEEAEAAYRQALKLDAEEAALWLSLGEVLWIQGKSAAAKEAYVKALAFDPTNQLAKQRLWQLSGN